MIPLPPEETLDPTTPQDWAALKAQGHQMLDDMFAYLQTQHTRPVWQAPSQAAIETTQSHLPERPVDNAQVYAAFTEHILPYNTGNVHPRFWGWVQGGGTPEGVLAEMLAATMNANTAIGNHMPMYIEQQVLNWCKELVGYPAAASGIFTSGGSMANITALAVARNSIPDFDIRQDGLAPTAGRLRLYCSTETHNCVYKGVELLGLGHNSIRKIPVDADYHIRIDLLKQAIAEDKAAGLLPFAMVANAGTVNTGATDDIAGMADIAAAEQLWLHVDGAFGALAYISEAHWHQLAGMDRADSLGFDLHKWMYMPYELGCLLVKDPAKHRAAFASPASYLLEHAEGLSAGPDPFANYGPELSRGFRSLKAWFSFQTHGADKYRRLIGQNIQQAAYLAGLVEAAPELELLAPVPLNIVCFRYRVTGWDDARLNELNKRILMALHTRGLAAPTYTLLQGRYAIRVANTNHRSRNADFEALVQDVVALGIELQQAG